MEAADQVVNYAFKGGEMSIRLVGSGVKNLALLLAALLKDASRTKGQVRLSRLLKEGKEQTVFSVKRGDDFRKFHALAKTYGVLFSVVNNPNAQDFDIIIKAEDIPKVKHIFEKLGLGEVPVQAQIVPEDITQEQTQEHATPDQEQAPEHSASSRGQKQKRNTNARNQKAEAICVEEPAPTGTDIELGAIEKERDEIIEHKGTITYCDELIKESAGHPERDTNILQFQKEAAIETLRDTYNLEPDGVDSRVAELDKLSEPLEAQRAAHSKELTEQARHEENSDKGAEKGKNQQTRKAASRSDNGLRESNAPQAVRPNTTERFSIKDALADISQRQSEQKAPVKHHAHSREPQMKRGGR